MNQQISVHDNVLVSYEVNCEQRAICLRTEFRDLGLPFEQTDVIFTGVVAYEFKFDASTGTIIFDIECVPAIDIYNDNLESIKAGIRYGWPGAWAADADAALRYFYDKAILGYRVDSACGLCGWILAQQEARTRRDPKRRE